MSFSLTQRVLRLARALPLFLLPILPGRATGCASPVSAAALPVVAITDGFSSSTELLRELLFRGAQVVHLRSSPTISDPYFAETFRRSGLTASENGPLYEVIHDGNVIRTATKLRQRGVTRMGAGAESGVELYDQMAEILGIPGNGTRLSAARRDKELMGNVVSPYIKNLGYEPVKKFTSNDPKKLVDWWRRRLRGQPAIVKPTTGLGSYGLKYCETEKDIIDGALKFLGKPNPLGLISLVAMIQEYLAGLEFAVNTVSWKGVHKVIDIWIYEKILVPGASFLYATDKLMRAEDPRALPIATFAKHTLDALAIKYGPGHTEVKEGPRHVETAARMSGSGVPEVVFAAQGYSQVTATADALLDEEAFNAIPDMPLPRSRGARIVFINASRSGKFNASLEPLLKDLPGYLSHSFNFEDGDDVDLSVDSDSQLAQINLVHASEEKMDDTEKLLRNWEKAGAFLK